MDQPSPNNRLERPGATLPCNVRIRLTMDCVERRSSESVGCLPKTRGWPTIVRMDYLSRIGIDPEVRFGKPCIRGTRITVGDVLSYLASGMSEAEILADFPQLTGDDIRACFAFAAERERRILGVPAA